MCYELLVILFYLFINNSMPAKKSTTSKSPVSKVKKDFNKINFAYVIKNDWKQISKKFEWEWGSEDIILTLLTVLISDVKTNIAPEGYKSFLEFINIQYVKELMPELIENNWEDLIQE